MLGMIPRHFLVYCSQHSLISVISKHWQMFLSDIMSSLIAETNLQRNVTASDTTQSSSLLHRYIKSISTLVKSMPHIMLHPYAILMYMMVSAFRSFLSYIVIHYAHQMTGIWQNICQFSNAIFIL